MCLCDNTTVKILYSLIYNFTDVKNYPCWWICFAIKLTWNKKKFPSHYSNHVPSTYDNFWLLLFIAINFFLDNLTQYCKKITYNYKQDPTTWIVLTEVITWIYIYRCMEWRVLVLTFCTGSHTLHWYTITADNQRPSSNSPNCDTRVLFPYSKCNHSELLKRIEKNTLNI